MIYVQRKEKIIYENKGNQVVRILTHGVLNSKKIFLKKIIIWNAFYWFVGI